MQDAELGAHLAEQISDFRPVPDPVAQRHITRFNRVPVDAAQIWVIGKIAMQAPGVEDQLPPLLFWIDKQLKIVPPHRQAARV